MCFNHLHHPTLVIYEGNHRELVFVPILGYRRIASDSSEVARRNVHILAPVAVGCTAQHMVMHILPVDLAVWHGLHGNDGVFENP